MLTFKLIYIAYKNIIPDNYKMIVNYSKSKFRKLKRCGVLITFYICIAMALKVGM